MIGIFVGLTVIFFVIGLVAAVSKEHDRKNGKNNDEDTAPTIMIMQEVPNPLDVFKKKK